ncbi:MAG TPA: CHAT domain-containing protein [Thermoanaerobaculia bacterium]|nr:CHAT domain-containing protein [Thermoanaerobaculia bacterium]
MDYQDFVLQLDRAPGGDGFITRVIRSPAGEAEAPFVNPVRPQDLDFLWEGAEDARKAEGIGNTRDAVSMASSTARDQVEAERSLEELGERLFLALFHGPVRSCWARSLEQSVHDPEKGLRLKLQVNLEDRALAPLMELPWEYLFSPEHRGFLGLQRQTPILRHVRLPLPPGQPPVAQALRVLIVSLQPERMRRLSLARESERIASVLAKLPGVQALPLHNPTVETLRDTLLRQQFHVLHFMGHGGFDTASGQGVLYFAGEGGASVPVGGRLLASHLTGLPSLRLVFLNACDTGRSNASAPFAGVATALLRAGLPAVIAMQQPIRDGAALELSRAVYRRLAAGDPIDAAVTEGRLAIARGHGALLEWGTPVLFLRSDDGRLFEAAAKPSAPPAEPLAPLFPAAPPAPARQGSRRLLSSLLIAAVLAGAAGIGASRWLASPAEESRGPARQQEAVVEPSPTPEPAPTPEKEEKRLVRGDVVQPTRTVPRDEPPAPRVEKEEAPPAPPPSSPGSYVVSDGGSVSIPVLEVDVGASFHGREGYPFARFWIAPWGGEMLQQPPIMGPKSIAFPAPDGTYHLDVLTLDFEGKRATVRVRFAS